ncbi:MAG TPA: GNAT family N-acetyltransferase [Candidatus Baltobacteraceae bacterium]|nr:GNAT family N-acetyltransferase [Candidatus Baltobacteraceae bacterium]
MSEPQIAAAKEADVRALAARRWPDESSRRLYVSLAENAPRGAFVARDEGTPIAIAFAHELANEWFVSELYVEPSFRGAGLGWKLLRSATDESGDVSLAGVIEANDTASLAFFLRRGMGLHVPLLRVAGEIPKEEELLPMAAGDYRFVTMPIDASAHSHVIGTLDRETRGTARPEDHVRFAQAAMGTLFLLNDELVGYAYVWPDGRIGPMVAASAAYLTQFFGFALVSLRRTYGASWCTALVPGSNVRVMRAAVRIGLVLDEVRIFATDLPLIDFSRYVGFHALDF